MPIGLTLPFARSTGSVGYFEFTEDELQAVHQNLMSLLVTNWGERVMHYNFGCNLVEFLFEPRTRELRERIGDRILSQVTTWVPFISVDVLNVFFTEDDPAVPENGIGVRIEFRLTSRPDLGSVFSHVLNP
jgi:phage baseplate assembly protein W